jgi:1,4-alpha-glucan branching enzyme
VRISLPLTSTGLASIRMKAVTAGTEPLLTQVCMVPRWTTMSPTFRCTITTVEFEVNFTRQHDHVVHGFGSVRESRMAGGPLVDPERRTPTVAHIIAVLDETCPLVSVSGRRVVDWHLISRPDLAARDTRGYPWNCGDLLIGLNDGFSTDVVTSYDASYFHSHTVFLLLCRRLFQCVELGETATSPARRRNQGEALNSTRKSFAGRTIPSGGGDLMPPSLRK